MAPLKIIAPITPKNISVIALDFFLLFVFDLELSFEWLSVGANVGAIYGSFGETNNTLDKRIVLAATPTLASGCRYKRSAKTQRTSHIHFQDFNAIHLERGTGFLHGRNVKIHQILIILGNIRIITVGEEKPQIKSINNRHHCFWWLSFHHFRQWVLLEKRKKAVCPNRSEWLQSIRP